MFDIYKNKMNTQGENERIKELESIMKTMRVELKQLKTKANIAKDCMNKKQKYDNDIEYRTDRIEKSKKYYYDVIKPRLQMAKNIIEGAENPKEKI
jgi:predicted RNase H-like nuclease (RuvC/YqgF family)